MTVSIMVMGTSSNVGKSIMATALCRIFAQDGYAVAPFKAQNMSLNSAVTPSGREIGRAQAVQAEACGILPNEHMNPVLLKPSGHMQSQIVLQGRPIGVRSAKSYFFDRKDEIWSAVVDSYEYLAKRHEVLIIEGAGSPVEVNLKHRDIANMRVAKMAGAHVLLVADIDRGGVFASVVGTLQLLDSFERSLVKGIVINKFRGDIELFEEGRRWLEEYTGVPVLGVLPYLGDIGIDEEDSVALSTERYRTERKSEPALRIGIVQLPHISNFTDFDPLFLEPDVEVTYCDRPDELVGQDALILPGTKATLLDLQWLDSQGMVDGLHRHYQSGGAVAGICGGYQMLGNLVQDPLRTESDLAEAAGLGWLDTVTVMAQTKRTVLVQGALTGIYQGIRVKGYEIHMGKTTDSEGYPPFACIHAMDEPTETNEGALSKDGRLFGTYLHGIYHNDEFRTAWLNRLRTNKGLAERKPTAFRSRQEDFINRLADTVRMHLNMAVIREWAASPGTGT